MVEQRLLIHSGRMVRVNEFLSDLVNRLAAEITSAEGRDRRRKTKDQHHFLHGI